MEREGSPPECTTGSTVYNSIYKIYLNVLNKYQQYHKILSYMILILLQTLFFQTEHHHYPFLGPKD